MEFTFYYSTKPRSFSINWIKISRHRLTSLYGAELEFQINLFHATASLYFLGRFFRLEPALSVARVFSRDRLFVVPVDTYNGSMMHFWRLDRRQMGAFLCIASNDVPPAVSKRIILNVNCEYTFNAIFTIFDPWNSINFILTD